MPSSGRKTPLELDLRFEKKKNQKAVDRQVESPVEQLKRETSKKPIEN